MTSDPMRECRDRRPLPLWDASEIPDPPVVEPYVESNPAPKKDLRREAERWIRENPEGFAMFERYAFEAVDAGCAFGVGALTERVRWQANIDRLVRDERGFKINNNHRAYIARALIARYPRIGAFLSCRRTAY